MFWTDWGTHPKIERAALDGTMRQLVIGTQLVWPNGVVIDAQLRRIFWCDAGKDVIEVSVVWRKEEEEEEERNERERDVRVNDRRK